jgi:hypothetical protein
MCALLFAENIITTCSQLSIYKVLVNHIMKLNNKKQCQSIFFLICDYNNFKLIGILGIIGIHLDLFAAVS